MGRRKGSGKIKQIKVPTFEIINHEAKPRPEAYKLMDELRKSNHDSIKDANILLAYRKGWKSNVDGHLILGKCIKASELQRELVDWDFVILLNFEVWNSQEFDRKKKLALLDHELCHAEPALDREGEPKVNAAGKRVWRIRDHDVQEFTEIIARHGCYKKDLQRFAETIMKQAQKTLDFAAPKEGEAVVVQ